MPLSYAVRDAGECRPSIAATPESLGLSMLLDDALIHRVAESDRAALVDAALGEGHRLAAAADARWGNDPVRIAERCDVRIEEVDDPSGYGTTLVFADYAPSTRTITLYRPALARLDRLLAAPDIATHVGVDTCRSLFIAHELFHHFDCTDARGPLARRHPVTVLRLGRWRLTSGLTSLAEIAAGAFAQSLLRLRVHPRWVDLLVAGRVASPPASFNAEPILRP